MLIASEGKKKNTIIFYSLMKQSKWHRYYSFSTPTAKYSLRPHECMSHWGRNGIFNAGSLWGEIEYLGG